MKPLKILKPLNLKALYFFRDSRFVFQIFPNIEIKLKIYFKSNEIEKIQKINQIDGKTYPEEGFTENIKLLKGFNNRLNEKILSIKDLFKL